MNNFYNRIAQVFFKLAYRMLLAVWFFTRPTVYGVYIAVWHREQLLIIKNSYKKRLTIPCGRIKRGENSADAAVRELYEEVGISVEKSRLKHVGKYSAQHKFAFDVGNFYEIEMSELPHLRVDSREVIQAQFVPLERVYKLALSPTVKAWLNNR